MKEYKKMIHCCMAIASYFIDILTYCLGKNIVEHILLCPESIQHLSLQHSRYATNSNMNNLKEQVVRVLLSAPALTLAGDASETSLLILTYHRGC